MSVSFGTQALFRWKGKPCPHGEASLCCVRHGDILVMDGQCQDEFLHRTDLARNRNGSTLRSVGSNNMLPPVPYGQGIMLFANVCAGFICCCYEGCWVWRFLGHSGCSLESCAYGRCWRCWSFPSCLQNSGYGGVLITGHGLWVEVGGGIICVTLGEFTGVHKSAPHVFK